MPVLRMDSYVSGHDCRTCSTRTRWPGFASFRAMHSSVRYFFLAADDLDARAPILVASASVMNLPFLVVP